LPFEADFYKQHEVPVCFVGHPLASQIPLHPDALLAKRTLGLDAHQPILCVMPGSRAGEVKLLAELFLTVAEQIGNSLGGLQIVIPAANHARYDQLKEIISRYEGLNVRLLLQQSHLAMESADAILLASGTTALEAMLFKKPMVVSYRLGALTYALVSPFIKTPFVSIPNLLAGEMLVPELIQNDATVEALVAAVNDALNSDKKQDLIARFDSIHESLAIDSGTIGAEAIAKLLAS